MKDRLIFGFTIGLTGTFFIALILISFWWVIFGNFEILNRIMFHRAVISVVILITFYGLIVYNKNG